VIFDERLRQTVLKAEKHGFVDGAIAHVLLRPDLVARNSVPSSSIVLATAGGLTEIAGDRVRSITAFHGLASNHLYTSLNVGSRLFVGSLAGLAELDGLRVVRTYKTSNSRLSHNWVSALAELDGTLYVGTNGGGVDALLPTGEWISFDDDVGRFEVNQNAMHTDNERLYVGTSDRGLLVYNTRARRWSRLSSGFPSQGVTALTSDRDYIYAGTLNGLIRIEKLVAE
jgi:ligand-binding sensor domain-containing protein